VAEASGIDASQVAADPRLSTGGQAAAAEKEESADAVAAPPGRAPAEAPATGRLPLFGGGMRVERPKAEAATTFTPVSLAAARAAKIRALPFERKQYETVRDLARLKAWLERALDGGVVAITTKTDTIDPMQATLCGFSLAIAPNEAC